MIENITLIPFKNENKAEPSKKISKSPLKNDKAKMLSKEKTDKPRHPIIKVSFTNVKTQVSESVFLFYLFYHPEFKVITLIRKSLYMLKKNIQK